MAIRANRRSTIDAESISDAALRLFSERGYQATTMEDLGAVLGIRGPSLYKHVRSKHDLLVEIMLNTMNSLVSNQIAALDAGGTVATKLRRTVEAHVRYHAAHRDEAFVGNREILSLDTDYRDQILKLRDDYEHRLRALIEEGCALGDFSVPSVKLVSFAILEMGMGVAAWFNPEGELSVDQVAYTYAEIALRMVINPSRSASPPVPADSSVGGNAP
jgi:AcrR family transcriptional regulator